MLLKSISQRELSDKDLDESLFDLNIALLESDVSQEVIDDLSQQIKDNLVGMKLQKNETTEQIIASTLKDNFSKILAKAGSVDLISAINAKKQRKGGPFKIVFLGINGTGKTTTVAKIANLLKKSGFSVVIAAADTHRAGSNRANFFTRRKTIHKSDISKIWCRSICCFQGCVRVREQTLH